MTKKLTTDWVDLDFKPLNPPHPHFEFAEKLGFLCKPLGSVQWLNVKSSDMVGDAAGLAIRYALRDWRGISRNGEPVKFSLAEVEKLFEDARLVELLADLCRRICDRSMLHEDEAKN